MYRGIGVGLAALALTAVLPASAEAATLQPSCSTTGANGTITVPNFSGATDRIDLSYTLYDSKADDHHVRIRLLTKNQAGTVKYWPWRANYDGHGSLKEWDTFADDSSGIFAVGVEVARFEGSSKLNSCTDWS
jgi:hypothetical protein